MQLHGRAQNINRCAKGLMAFHPPPGKFEKLIARKLNCGALISEILFALRMCGCCIRVNAQLV